MSGARGRGGRGRCPYCHRDYALRKDGTLRLHDRGSARRMGGGPSLCAGSGQVPAGQGGTR